MDGRISVPGNSKHQNHVPIAGSHRDIVAGAARVAPVDPKEVMSVTIVLQSRATLDLERHIETLSLTPVSGRNYLTHEEVANQHGADPKDIKQVEAFASEYGLTVNHVNAAASTMIVSGTSESIGKAFAVELGKYQHPDFSYRGHTGPVYVPEHLSRAVTAVLGLDNRPQAKPHFRIREETPTRSLAAAQVSYTPTQVAQLYNFPNVDCKDQCIGIIELGGGYNTANLNQYFSGLGVPLPTITAVSVDGGSNQPTGSANGPDGEVDLDIEVAGCVAKGARIVVYFAPNTDAGFLNAITTAAHDTTNKPSVVSISWGGPESSWTSSAMHAMNAALKKAAALGITVCCAAGDSGSTDGVNDGQFHVDFPASAPYSLACGGTRLEESGGTISSETVWNDGVNGGATGGGVSAVFPLPKWQESVHVPPSANPGGHVGRGVPDVAGDADPATGYQVLVDGQSIAIGGTSAVAPLWAGLIALANQTLGHQVGYMNPVIYGIPGQDNAFHDITSGNNDISGRGQVYPAGPGWDACTGLGSPNGANLIQAFRQGGAKS